MKLAVRERQPHTSTPTVVKTGLFSLPQHQRRVFMGIVPAAMMYFLEYLSPRYPKMGAT